ncbi:XVIPCD domain-containing protein [Frateuria defendens]|uniref:XVIPCD domain-containing protein n=1 Tax=Frateuria defendens TaxID=2219559 RepID=UPI00066FDE41|nr:XVIPCD domain-containing protein [Frateuria defendens]
MSGSIDHQQEQALLQQLRASGDTAAQDKAAQLQKLYHDRQMGELAADVYDAATGAGQPPSGWVRASEHPDRLREYASKLHMADSELKEALHPDKSGFRAEVYLPDPSVLGSGYRPVVAYKGSSGEVRTSQGLRDTTQEDFLANNFPQSIGLETDYYDRAMGLASQLKINGLDFELTGHSLAGGMASAAAAVTGNAATTWNAAGLHPETAKRFGEQNGLSVYDVSHRVTAYQVQGELLSNGVQENLHAMDVNQRAELSGVLKETSRLLNALPEGRELLKRQLDKSVPPEAQASVRAFVDKVATGDTDQMLRDLPLAAGNVQPLLAPMVRLNPNDPASPLLARNHALSLPEVTYLAGPVLKTMSAAAQGAHVGERGGEVAAAVGRMAHQALRASGDGVRSAAEMGGQVSRAVTQFEGAAAQAAERYAGGVAARSREAVGEAQAWIDQGLGHAQKLGASMEAGLLRGVGGVLPDGVRAWTDTQAGRLDQAGEEADRRGQALAAEARRQGHADAAVTRGATRALQSGTGRVAAQVGQLQYEAVNGVGHLAGSGLDVAGQYVQNTTRHAPAVGAMVGAALGAHGAAALEPNPGNYPRLFGAVSAVTQVKSAGTEAFERHLMRPTVLPSMDSRIDKAERSAQQVLQRAEILPAGDLPARPLRLDDPSHAGHAMFQQIRDGVHKLDAQMGRVPDRHSENLAGALVVAAAAGGLSRIDAVVLSEDGSRAFAVQHVIPRALNASVHVETAQAIKAPLEQSSLEWQKAALQWTQTQVHAQAESHAQQQGQLAQQAHAAMVMSR